MMNFRHGLLLAFSVILTAVSGCGGDSRLPDGVSTGTVSGMITSDGSTLPEGCIISFLPTGETELPASGVVSADGMFELQVRDMGEIPTGIYKVIVQPPPLPTMTEEEETKAMDEGTSPISQIDQIPLKYMNPATTPETFEVKVGSNDVTIDMTE